MCQQTFLLPSRNSFASSRIRSQAIAQIYRSTVTQVQGSARETTYARALIDLPPATRQGVSLSQFVRDGSAEYPRFVHASSNVRCNRSSFDMPATQVLSRNCATSALAAEDALLGTKNHTDHTSRFHCNGKTAFSQMSGSQVGTEGEFKRNETVGDDLQFPRDSLAFRVIKKARSRIKANLRRKCELIFLSALFHRFRVFVFFASCGLISLACIASPLHSVT